MTLTPDVAAGTIIQSVWGNEVRDRTTQLFASVAARDTWATPPTGAVCVTLDTMTPWMRGAAGWFVLPGTVVAHTEDLVEVQWGVSTQAAIATASPVQFYAGTRYGITFDCNWRGTVLGDVHQFELRIAGAMARQWPISPARASVSGSSEHFHAIYPYTPPATAALAVSVAAMRLGGTGSGFVTIANLEIVSLGIQGTT
jgi:hypothetical protein